MPSTICCRHRLGALYPASGVQGLSAAHGVVENVTLLALIARISSGRSVRVQAGA
ncbi:hypothetical protein ACHWWK_27135 [Klebsiella pneumoniae]